MTSGSSFTDGCHLYILLIEPKTRQFDLVHVICPSREPRVDEILPILAIHTTEPIFRMQQHIGVCPLKLKSSKRHETTSLNASLDVTIKNFDLLMAVPQGSSEDYCRLIGHIIMEKNPRLVKWIRKHRKRIRKNIRAEAQQSCCSTSAGTSSIDNRKLLNSNNVPRHRSDAKTLACGTLFRPPFDKKINNNLKFQNGNLYRNTNNNGQHTTTDHKSNFINFNHGQNYMSAILSKKRKQGDLEIPNLLRLNCDSFESASSSEVSFHSNSPNSCDTHIISPTYNSNTNSKQHKTFFFHKKNKCMSEIPYASVLVLTVMITILNNISKSFFNGRATSLFEKEKPLDLNGVLTVIVFLFALSEIQRNWNNFHQYFSHKNSRPYQTLYRSPQSLYLDSFRKHCSVRRRRKSSIPYTITYQTSNATGHLFQSDFSNSSSKKLKITNHEESTLETYSPVKLK